MLRSDFESVSCARTTDELRDALVNFAGRLDFGLVVATLVTERGASPATFVSVANTPKGFVEAASSVPDSLRDPVLQGLKTATTPILYDQATYVRAGATDLWEVQAPFGYRTGIAIRLLLPEKRHLLLGVDRTKPLPTNEVRLTRLLADLQLLAAHLQHAAVELLAPASEIDTKTVPRLSHREVEVLRWVAKGKSDWDMSQILGVSEHTIDYYVRQITKKLECRGRHQAVQEAILLGLL